MPDHQLLDPRDFASYTGAQVVRLRERVFAQGVSRGWEREGVTSSRDTRRGLANQPCPLAALRSVLSRPSSQVLICRTKELTTEFFSRNYSPSAVPPKRSSPRPDSVRRLKLREYRRQNFAETFVLISSRVFKLESKLFRTAHSAACFIGRGARAVVMF